MSVISFYLALRLPQAHAPKREEGEEDEGEELKGEEKGEGETENEQKQEQQATASWPKTVAINVYAVTGARRAPEHSSRVFNSSRLLKDSELQGCLAKKKNNHGRFEDPWKQKVYCWITAGKFYLCSAGPDKKPVNIAQADVYNLLDWAVVPDKEGKFTLCSDTTSSADALKLKADSPRGAEQWIAAVRGPIPLSPRSTLSTFVRLALPLSRCLSASRPRTHPLHLVPHPTAP
jgi:hypothetical protein